MWLIVVRRICSVCGDGSVCGSGSVRCDDVLFRWRFTLMYGWGVGECFVGVVSVEEVCGGAYGCGGREDVVLVSEWCDVSGRGVWSSRVGVVGGGVGGWTCVGGVGGVCGVGGCPMRWVVWGSRRVSVGVLRRGWVVFVGERVVVGSGRVLHVRLVGGACWRDRVCLSYWWVCWWCRGEGSGGGSGCVGHRAWCRAGGSGRHRCDVCIVVGIVISVGWRGVGGAGCPSGEGEGAGDWRVGLRVRIVEVVKVGVIVIVDRSGVDVDG